jgi:hypothetical protein
VAEPDEEEQGAPCRQGKAGGVARADQRESDRVGRLWKVAEIAHSRLGSMGDPQKRQVLDLLDVRVHVTRLVNAPDLRGPREDQGRLLREASASPVPSGSRHRAL